VLNDRDMQLWIDWLGREGVLSMTVMATKMPFVGRS